MTGFLKKSLTLFLSIFVITAAQSAHAAPDRKACSLLPDDIPAAALAVDIESGEILLECDPHNLLYTPFPTGSLIKVFAAAVALDRSSFKPDTKFFCSQSKVDAPQLESCWYHRGHGDLSLIDAIAFSCNRYFISLAAYLDYGEFISVLKRLNFLVRNNDSKDSIDQKTINITGLGRNVKATPATVVYAFAALFNGGVVYTIDKNTASPERPQRKVKFSEQTINILRQGMHESVLKGTSARAAESAGTTDFIGKTGTAEYDFNGEFTRYKTHAWWVGMQPAGRPRTAIVVFILEGSGAGTAAPPGGEIMMLLPESKR